MTKLRPLTVAVLLTQLLMASTFLSAIQASPAQTPSSTTTIFQKGMSYATYANMTRDAFSTAQSNESLRRMNLAGAEWVAINVVWFQEKYTSTRIYGDPTKTPTNESVAKAVEAAHNQGMKIMLKPMIDLSNETDPDPWRGRIQPSPLWFQNYVNFINFFAEFAEEHGVEMLCIGTELNRTVTKEPEWRNVISGVRERYFGLLTYAAIWWREYDKLIRWWDALDYIGIDAYFPLSNKNDPTINEVQSTWQNIANYLDEFHETVKKPVIFTEIGYLSTDGTNTAPSNYRLQNEGGRLIDLQEQADCYEAAFQALWNKSWFYGMYWWYWQTSPDAGGSDNSDYTPQNKPAQGVLAHWYSFNAPHVSEGIEDTVLVIYGLFAVIVLESIALAILILRKRKLQQRT